MTISYLYNDRVPGMIYAMASQAPSRRGRPPKQPIEPGQIEGMNYLKSIMTLLRPLRDKEPKNANRELHYDELIAFILLYCCTPVLSSMRGLQQVSELKIIEEFGLHRFSLGSFSETTAVFDPKLLEPIIEELAQSVQAKDGKPELSVQDLTPAAVDGSLLHALPKMAWALWLDKDNHAAKMHLQFNILKGAPIRALLTKGNGSETAALLKMLAAGMLCVLDRGYASYALLDAIIKAHSSFVVRVDNNAVYEVIEERPLSAAAGEKGIERGLVVKLGGPKTSALYDRRLRLVQVHVKGGPTRKPANRVSGKNKIIRTTTRDHTLLLVSDLLDIDVELVAEIYRSRWQIELFFRWYKTILRANRLLCLTENGMTVVMHCAVIASLLITLWTCRKPGRRTYEMICLCLSGWVSKDELVAHIEDLPACG